MLTFVGPRDLCGRRRSAMAERASPLLSGSHVFRAATMKVRREHGHASTGKFLWPEISAILHRQRRARLRDEGEDEKEAFSLKAIIPRTYPARNPQFHPLFHQITPASPSPIVASLNNITSMWNLSGRMWVWGQTSGKTRDHRAHRPRSCLVLADHQPPK